MVEFGCLNKINPPQIYGVKYNIEIKLRFDAILINLRMTFACCPFINNPKSFNLSKQNKDLSQESSTFLVISSLLFFYIDLHHARLLNCRLHSSEMGIIFPSILFLLQAL